MTPAELGLHFDLTVPFARYVLENAHQLAFPFRRYQIQKVWRGERPQEGRYREFTQADIDIIDANTLAAHHDVELPLVALAALERLHVDLGVPPVLMRVSNRKLAQGFYRGLEIADPVAVLRQVDKIDKIGPDRVRDSLVNDLGLSDTQAAACVRLATISSADESFVDQVRALGVRHDELDEGLELLAEVVRTAARYVPGRLIADLKVARGLDYYTGTVYETELVGYESWGSISSGGRYDSLAADGRTTYPGVGLSIGVTRLLAPLFARGRAEGVPAGADGGAGHGGCGGDPRGGDRRRRATPSPGHRLRGGPHGGLPQADPLRRPPRDPLRLVRWPGVRRGQGPGGPDPAAPADPGRPGHRPDELRPRVPGPRRRRRH